MRGADRPVERPRPSTCPTGPKQKPATASATAGQPRPFSPYAPRAGASLRIHEFNSEIRLKSLRLRNAGRPGRVLGPLCQLCVLRALSQKSCCGNCAPPRPVVDPHSKWVEGGGHGVRPGRLPIPSADLQVRARREPRCARGAAASPGIAAPPPPSRPAGGRKGK